MSLLQSAKFWLVHNVGLAKDALAIHVGLTPFLGSALLILVRKTRLFARDTCQYPKG